MLNFTLINSFVAVYIESSDGVCISSLFDVVVEQFCIIIVILKPVSLGSLVGIQSKVAFNFSQVSRSHMHFIC